MSMKKQEIVDGDWDVLIILDACRYDDFNELYPKYLSGGKLKKRKSRGSNTPEFLARTFTDSMNHVTYISGNPHINSSGAIREKWGWNPKETFGLIVDVWDEHWDEEIGTVHPKAMVEMAEEYVNSEEKLIVHFVQPHKPFLSRKGRLLDGDAILKRRKKSKFKKRRGSVLKLAKPIIPLWLKISEKKRLKIKEALEVKLTKNVPFQKIVGIAPAKVHKRYYFEGKINELREYYRENLELALHFVSKLVQKIPADKKVVVTSDHGEAFGEGELFEHPPNIHVPVLVEVPWLELYGEGDIRKGKDNKKLSRNRKSREDEEKSQEKVKERLRDLGYMD